MFKYLGVDFGSKRIGLAISDESSSFAFPLVVLENKNEIEKEILNICQKNNIGEIVIGESKDFNMEENNIMSEVKKFIENFKKISDIKTVFHPEFMTSQEAERVQGKNKMLDASAAAIILKSYLDKIKNENGK